MKTGGIRSRLARIYAGTHLKYARETEEVNFSRVLCGSGPMLVVMPRELTAFESCIHVLKYLRHFVQGEGGRAERAIHPCLHEIYRNWIDARLVGNVVSWNDSDLNMLHLPDHDLINRIAALGCTVAIDLNLVEDLSASYICGITGAPVRMAIGARADARYFNLRIDLPASGDERLVYLAFVRQLHRAFFSHSGPFPENPDHL